MAAAPQSPLKLSSGSGESLTIYNPIGFIPPAPTFYTIATMIPGDIPTMWFVYSEKDWGHADSGVGSSIAVGDDGPKEASYPIVSAQGFNMVNPGIVLFEHSRYRGFGNLYQTSNPNITDSFPQGEISGASSMYISGGIWNLFSDFDYGGKKLSYFGNEDLWPGWYDFGDTSINDQAKSIKYIRAT